MDKLPHDIISLFINCCDLITKINFLMTTKWLNNYLKQLIFMDNVIITDKLTKFKHYNQFRNISVNGEQTRQIYRSCAQWNVYFNSLNLPTKVTHLTITNFTAHSQLHYYINGLIISPTIRCLTIDVLFCPSTEYDIRFKDLEINPNIMFFNYYVHFPIIICKDDEIILTNDLKENNYSYNGFINVEYYFDSYINNALGLLINNKKINTSDIPLECNLIQLSYQKHIENNIIFKHVLKK